MIPALKVIAPGLHTTLQDYGRRGFQDAGVPVSGPLDRIALRLANALVGNPQEMAALEILVQGPTLEVVADSLRVGLVGGSGGLDILDGQERVVPPGESVRLTQGMRLRVKPVGQVSCAYLAIEGGFSARPILRSVSTYARGKLGGFVGRPLATGDMLPAVVSRAEERQELSFPAPLDAGLNEPIRVVLGPQDDFFSKAAIETFFSSTYAISPQADRMGFRLEGAPLEHIKGYNIVSDAIVAGSIQVPGSGQPIVLLVDAQTTGGYPKIGTVASADLPLLGRRRPGDKVRFAKVGQLEAEALRREQEHQIRAMVAGLKAAKRGGAVDTRALYEANLVGGMVNAFEDSAA